MVLIWLAYISGVLLIVRLMIVLTNLFTRYWLRRGIPDGEPFVSILIPARNEAANLPTLLSGLTALDYRNVEILVYDDVSEDDTPAIVEAFTRKDGRIRLLTGDGLPEGWLGKNYACHRLAEEARGAYLLFLDADVRVNNGLVRDSLAHMQRHGLSLLSIFPGQRMEGIGERSTVPLMNMILVSMLPMIAVRGSFRPSLAAANGQFMLFSGKVYRQHRFHGMLRRQSVEDIHICRTMKAMGYRVDTVLSSGQVECRMYRHYGEAITGFSRYMPAFFGGSIIGMLLFVLFSVFGILFVWLSLGWQQALLYLGLSVLLRVLVSLASRQPAWSNLLLGPVQQLTLLVMAYESVRKRLTKSNTWKGRQIVLEK